MKCETYTHVKGNGDEHGLREKYNERSGEDIASARLPVVLGEFQGRMVPNIASRLAHRLRFLDEDNGTESEINLVSLPSE